MSLRKPDSERATTFLKAVFAAILAVCCILFVVLTWHWPLIGDASMVHYLILLLAHGMAPYRQIVDAQMPGTYLLDWLVIHTFGGGALGLRLFDFTLLLLGGLAMMAIAWPHDRFAGFAAAVLLALLHGRDGIPQTAQRDLIMAVLMLGAFAAIFHSLRRSRPAWMFFFGLCAAIGTTIKPTVLPVALLLVLAAVVLRRTGRPMQAYLGWGIAGLALPFFAVIVFLLREHAIPAFVTALHQMWPYYVTLDKRPLSWLLVHSVSPVMPLVVLWLLMLAAQRFFPSGLPQVPDSKQRDWAHRDWERWALWMGLALGMISYIGQRKGFPYQRYPVLAFLLLLMALDFTRALHRRGLLRLCGIVALASWALILAPVSTWKISTYDWRRDELFAMLQSDLRQQGGPALSGHVQCLDTFSGCINALYRMNLVQSTGFLVDFYFWAPPQLPVTISMRQRFWSQIQLNPPRVFIVMKQDFPSHTPSYDKLARWPQFNSWLQAHYVLASDRTAMHWVFREGRPYPPISYRIYVEKQ